MLIRARFSLRSRTPQILRMLAEDGARATFFCVAERAQAHPEMIRAIVEGHKVENHTYHHTGYLRGYSRCSWRGTSRAHRVLTALAGETPGYFRTPAGHA
ncbi:MAG TPA: polysaccharide deacetylase family protein [Gammaproteobacteria bacterium]|nr:polysaccharide deacetylase family protein [Gammaproteobacteria bacterium]